MLVETPPSGKVKRAVNPGHPAACPGRPLAGFRPDGFALMDYNRWSPGGESAVEV